VVFWLEFILATPADDRLDLDDPVIKSMHCPNAEVNLRRRPLHWRADKGWKNRSDRKMKVLK